jgi:hypothetical protein
MARRGYPRQRFDNFHEQTPRSEDVWSLAPGERGLAISVSSEARLGGLPSSRGPSAAWLGQRPEDRVARARVVEAGVGDVVDPVAEHASGAARVGGVVGVRAGAVGSAVPVYDREAGAGASTKGGTSRRRATNSHRWCAHVVISKVRHFFD